MSEKAFHLEAVQSFERTFRCIFKQANEEVDRLERINSAMNLLENRLLDPETIEAMDTMQQIALMELLSKNQQAAIKNVMGFSGTLAKVKTVVGVFDGIQRYASLPGSPDGEFPELEYDDRPISGQLLESE
jgi:hypothetical protein